MQIQINNFTVVDTIVLNAHDTDFKFKEFNIVSARSARLNAGMADATQSLCMGTCYRRFCSAFLSEIVENGFAS